MTPAHFCGLEQRHAKFMEHKLKCTKARNDYLLSLASVNAAVRNYYEHDVLALMDVSAGWTGGGGGGAQCIGTCPSCVLAFSSVL